MEGTKAVEMHNDAPQDLREDRPDLWWKVLFFARDLLRLGRNDSGPAERLDAAQRDPNQWFFFSSVYFGDGLDYILNIPGPDPSFVTRCSTSSAVLMGAWCAAAIPSSRSCSGSFDSRRRSGSSETSSASTASLRIFGRRAFAMLTTPESTWYYDCCVPGCIDSSETFLIGTKITMSVRHVPVGNRLHRIAQNNLQPAEFK